MCSWNRHYCWPGSCSNDLTSNCQCTDDFRKVSSASETLCQPDTYPEVLDCQTVYTGTNGEKRRLISNTQSTHCENLQDTYGNFQPIEITYNMTSEFTINVASLPHPKYIKTEKFGITDTTIILRKLSTSGSWLFYLKIHFRCFTTWHIINYFYITESRQICRSVCV